MKLERQIQKSQAMTVLQKLMGEPQRLELVVRQTALDSLLAGSIQMLEWSLQKKMKTTVPQKLCFLPQKVMVMLQKLALMLRHHQS